MAQNNDVRIEGYVPSPNTNGGISGTNYNMILSVPSRTHYRKFLTVHRILWTDIVKKGTKWESCRVNV